MNRSILQTALTGIAMAMGVAILVLNVLKTLNINQGLTMVGIGLAALALSQFQK
jgi:hypothetical protein